MVYTYCVFDGVFSLKVPDGNVFGKIIRTIRKAEAAESVAVCDGSIESMERYKWVSGRISAYRDAARIVEEAYAAHMRGEEDND